MQRSLSLFLLVILLCLLLSGCDNTEGEIQTPTFVVPSATTIPTIKKTIQPTAPLDTAEPTLEEVFTQTPTKADVAFNHFEAVHCGEIFCQVNWPGLLDRPIGSTYQNTIDRSYPYASTQQGMFDPHHGVEFPNPSGTPVSAAADGVVVYAGTDDLTVLGPYTGFYGNVIILRHPELYEGDDLFTLYAHLSVIDIEVGDKVAAGDTIGKVGASGAADGSHLHFEVRWMVNDYNHTINPVLWFEPVFANEIEPMAALAGSIIDRYGYPVTEFVLTLEKLSENGSIQQRYYPQTYIKSRINEHPALQENFAFPDIPPGDYRLAFVYGRLHEVFFTLNSGSLGFIKIQLD